MVVVDYADRWPREDLEALLFEVGRKHRIPGSRGTLPVRILLLARSVGSWWTAFANRLTKMEFTTDTLALGDISTEDRIQIFEAAHHEFSELLEVPCTLGFSLVGSLDSPAYDNPLAILLAALVSVDASAKSVKIPTGPIDMSRYVLDREYDHWATMYRNGQISIQPNSMARIV